MLFVAGSLFLVLSGFLPVRFCGMLVCFVVLLVEAFGVHECDCNDGKYILDEQTPTYALDCSFVLFEFS